MIVGKVHENFAYEQSWFLEKDIFVLILKRNQAINDFEKDFYEVVNNAFYVKAVEKIRNSLKRNFI